MIEFARVGFESYSNRGVISVRPYLCSVVRTLLILRSKVSKKELIIGQISFIIHPLLLNVNY